MTVNRLLSDVGDVNFLSRAEQKSVGSLCNKHAGIINAIMHRYELQQYGLSMFQSLSAKTTVLFSLPREVSSGGLGVDFDDRNAFFACVGESIERYCMSYFDEGSAVYSTWSGLPLHERARDFSLYSQSQYSSIHFVSPKSGKHWWVRLHGLNGNSLYWPAGMVYLPWTGTPVAEVTSTGVACHKNKSLAIRGGILEVIERDALMLHFYRMIRAPIINVESLTAELKHFMKAILKDFDVRIYAIHHDTGIPVFYSLIWDRAKNTHFGIGAGANLDSDVAIRKSLVECLFTYFYSKSIMDLRVSDKRKIHALYEHFLYYQGAKFKNLLVDGEKIRYVRRRLSQKTLLSRLAALGHDVYYTDITTHDVKCAGLVVVRVVIPGFIDLNKSHVLPRLAAKRFKTVPDALNLRCDKEFSDEPHPFP